MTSGNNLPWVKDQTDNTTWSSWNASNRDLYILNKNDEITEVINLSSSFDEEYIKSVIDNLHGYHISIENFNSSSSTFDIILSNEGPVSGFQFDISGVSIVGVYGGTASSNGFSTTSSSTTILGFSFSGNTIPPGNEKLLEISYTDYTSQICIENVILSDSQGNALDVTVGECY